MEKIAQGVMNQFAPTEEIKGRKDLKANLDAYSGVVASTQTDPLLPGDPVSIVTTSKGLPQFKKAAAGEVIMGFVDWEPIRPSYSAGQICQVSYANDVMYMESAAAVNAGVAVNITDLDDVLVGAVTGAGSTIGYTLEAATAANQLVRVRITAPVAYAANTVVGG